MSEGGGGKGVRGGRERKVRGSVVRKGLKGGSEEGTDVREGQL